MNNRLANFYKLIRAYGFFKGMSIYQRLISDKDSSFVLHGLEMHIRGGSSDAKVFLQVWLNNEYDIPLKSEAEVIIDAGANIGLASLYFKDKYPKASIYAIEPEKGNFDQLVKNTMYYWNVPPTIDSVGVEWENKFYWI